MKWALFVLAFLLWIAIMYFGLISVVQNSMKDQPTTNSEKSWRQIKQSAVSAEDLAERHKRLMEDRSSRMRDQKRY